jgi:hypothetical protein
MARVNSLPCWPANFAIRWHPLLRLPIYVKAVGHQVAVEHGTHKALERASVYGPDVCLLDIALPDIDGMNWPAAYGPYRLLHAQYSSQSLAMDWSTPERMLPMLDLATILLSRRSHVRIVLGRPYSSCKSSTH